MSPKKGSSSTNKEGINWTQIIVAVIGLISTFTVAYLGYRQIVDSIHFSTSITQTADARNSLISPTNTSIVTSTETLPPTLEPSVTSTQEATPTFTPTPLITLNCLTSEIWDYTPRKTIPTDGCWKVKEFRPNDNGIQIGAATVLGSGEQQRGFYALLDGDLDIQFTIKINNFDSQKISQDKTQRSNLALGIVEGNPFNYYNGVYVYYYASKPDVSTYESQLAKEQDVAYNGALSVDREQVIRFRIHGNRLTVYIDGTAIDAYTLTFNQNAFYVGYRLFDNADLSATLSDLSFAPLQ